MDGPGWTTEYRYQRAEAEMLRWTERCERLHHEMTGRPYVPKPGMTLSAEDARTLCVILDNIVRRAGPPTIDAADSLEQTARDLLARLDAAVATADLDKEPR